MRVLDLYLLALMKLGRKEEAKQKFIEVSNEEGDFQDMAVTIFSEMTFYKGLALLALGEYSQAGGLFHEMKAWAQWQKSQTAKIDYFATSLPNLLVFEEDIQQTHLNTMNNLIALAEKGLERCKEHQL